MPVKVVRENTPEEDAGPASAYQAPVLAKGAVTNAPFDKHQVDLFFRQHLHGTECILARSYQLQERDTDYIARQLLERQGLVINSNAFDHNNGIISKTLKLSSRSLIDKV